MLAWQHRCNKYASNNWPAHSGPTMSLSCWQSYLELISLYKELLARKREELRQSKERLENGVTKIAQASAQVADLQVNLKQEQIIVEEKKANTGALIETIGKEKAVVDEAVEAGREDEEAAAKLQVRLSLLVCGCASMWHLCSVLLIYMRSDIITCRLCLL